MPPQDPILRSTEPTKRRAPPSVMVPMGWLLFRRYYKQPVWPVGMDWILLCVCSCDSERSFFFGRKIVSFESVCLPPSEEVTPPPPPPMYLCCYAVN